LVLREFVTRAALRPADPAPEKVKIRNITLAPEHGTTVILQRTLTRPDTDYSAIDAVTA
jgi:hypothetical protein